VDRAAPLLRDLSLASLASFEELATLPELKLGLVRNGLLMLCKTQEALDEEIKTAAMAERLGIPAHVLSASEIAGMEPGITLDVVGAVHFPKDCHLTPDHFLRSLRTHLEAMKVDFRWRTQALNFETQGSVIRRVRTTRGAIDADEFVICGGAWSSELGRSLALRLPIQAGKGYSLTLPDPPELPRICSILTEARVAVTPMGGALRVAGTMEIGGQHDTINTRRVRGILKALPQYYPAFEAKMFEGIRPWMGRRPVSPDGLPYLGRPTRWGNVVVATGHAMMGLSLGPISGKLVAELIDGENPSVDLQLFKPDRYG
jgi:D-amino-acid dehydrogenase